MVHAERESQASRSQTNDIPQVKESQLVLGVIHPFFVCSNYRKIDKEPPRSDERLSRLTNLAELSPNVDDEVLYSERILEDIVRESSKNPLIVFVARDLKDQDFNMMKKRFNESLFDLPDRKQLIDPTVDDKMVAEGFTGNYGELCMLANIMRKTSPDNIAFFQDNINKQKAYDLLSDTLGDKRVYGRAYGTYGRNCVRDNRNTLCDALNIPYTHMPVIKSRCADEIWPTQPERKEKQADIGEQLGVSGDYKSLPKAKRVEAVGLYREWAEPRIREYHGTLPEGVSISHQAFSSSLIRTYHRHPEYLEKTFSKYRINGLSERLEGKTTVHPTDGESYERDMHFPPGEKMARDIGQFLRGIKPVESIVDKQDRKPWEADRNELDEVKLRLARLLSGNNQMDASQIKSFSDEYTNAVR